MHTFKMPLLSPRPKLTGHITLRRLKMASLSATLLLLSACAPKTDEDQLVGRWIQSTVDSSTHSGVEVRRSNGILNFTKDGQVELSRTLEFMNPQLPNGTLNFDVRLDGRWFITDKILTQTPTRVDITAHSDDAIARQTADAMKKDPNVMETSRKTILKLDDTSLMLQDRETGLTDVYKR